MSLLILTASSLNAGSFTTSLDRNVVPMGETVTFNLVFEGLSPSSAATLPQFPNLQVAPGASQSSQFSFVNGQQTSRLTYSYTLIPTAPGDVTIPALQVTAAGQTLTSQPLSVKIVPATAGGASIANPMTNLAFVRLVVPKTEVYVGEPFPIEIQLYWQTAEDIRMPQLQADGFSLGQMPQPNQSRTQVGNGIYQLATFRQTATAARSGTLKLGPVEETLKILVPINNRRSRDPFDFFGPRYQGFPTTLTSAVVSVQALPLPAQGAPANFNGAIGSYQLSVTAGPTNLAVGDPITVRAQISGRGPLDAIVLPAQPQWRDFTSYPPSAKLETIDDLGLAGTKTFELVLVPQNHEIKSLPPMQFSFFDPTVKSYRTLTSREIPLQVRPSATGNAPPPSLTNTAAATQPAPADDIVHIRPRLDVSRSAASLLLAQPWFLGLQGVPAAIWLALVAWRKRQESLANNPRLRRQREVAARIREGLRELRGHGAGERSAEFFATLFRLLQEQLGERLDLPASAITEAVLEERVRGRGLPDGTIQSLHDLFQACNLARYAPVQTSQQLAELLPKLEGALRDLQQLKA